MLSSVVRRITLGQRVLGSVKTQRNYFFAVNKCFGLRTGVTPKNGHPLKLVGANFRKASNLGAEEASLRKDHVYLGKKDGVNHWKLERITILALAGAIFTAGYRYSFIPDLVLAITIPIHTFWGVNAILLDYVPTRMIKTALNAWKAASIIHLLGLLMLTFRDMGISKLCLAFLYL